VRQTIERSIIDATTLPSALKTGPPLSPGLIGAWVSTVRASICCPERSRAFFLYTWRTVPDV
jgi:hypothetical protein